MKKIVSVIAILIFAITLIACKDNGNFNGSGSKTDEEAVRTTITEDEWNKTLQMDNFTMKLEYPNTRIVTMVSKNAIKAEANGDFPHYYVKKNGNFYLVESIDDIWCKYSDIKGDSSFTSFSNQFVCNTKFEDLVYDEEQKAYIEHLMVDGLETYLIYSFENGVLTEIKHSSRSWDFTAYYTITNIGETIVDAPQYIPLEIYYALEVMPNGGEFEEIDVDSYAISQNIKEAYKASSGGYVFTVEFRGYSEGNIIVVGVDSDGYITKVKVVQNNEVMGEDALNNAESTGIVAGCSTTARGYNQAINNAIEAATILDSTYIK